jgi:hypothetical protein
MRLTIQNIDKIVNMNVGDGWIIENVFVEVSKYTFVGWNHRLKFKAELELARESYIHSLYYFIEKDAPPAGLYTYDWICDMAKMCDTLRERFNQIYLQTPLNHAHN